MQEVGDDHDGRPALRRTIGFPLLVLYGMGTMVGAGFFALSGEVAGKAGMHAPLAFGIAGLLALFSALAFAEWSSRLPHAGGRTRTPTCSVLTWNAGSRNAKRFAKRWVSVFSWWCSVGCSASDVIHGLDSEA